MGNNQIYFIGEEKVTEEEYLKDASLKNGLENLTGDMFFAFFFSIIYIVLVFLRNHEIYRIQHYIWTILLGISYFFTISQLLSAFHHGDFYSLFTFHYYGEKNNNQLTGLSNYFLIRLIGYVFIVLSGFLILPIRLGSELVAYINARLKFERKPKNFKETIYFPIFYMIAGLIIVSIVISIFR